MILSATVAHINFSATVLLINNPLVSPWDKSSMFVSFPQHLGLFTLGKCAMCNALNAWVRLDFLQDWDSALTGRLPCRNEGFSSALALTYKVRHSGGVMEPQCWGGSIERTSLVCWPIAKSQVSGKHSQQKPNWQNKDEWAPSSPCTPMHTSRLHNMSIKPNTRINFCIIITRRWIMPSGCWKRRDCHWIFFFPGKFHTETVVSFRYKVALCKAHYSRPLQTHFLKLPSPGSCA